MTNTIIAAIVSASALWVYLDATKHHIGKIPDTKGIFNMSAGAWGTVTLLLWIIGLPAYLIKRSQLISAAQTTPITASVRGAKAAAFGIIGTLWVLMTIGGAATSLPSCDSTDTEHLVGQIINDMPLVKSSGAQYVSLKDILEQGYNKAAQIRSCNATLVTTAGEDNLQYHIKWSNQEAGEFYVEAQIR